MTTNSSIIFNIAERNSFLHNAMIYYSYPNSLGYRLGMCSILVCWVTWDCIWGYVKDGHSTIGGRTAFPVFRACGGLLLVHWFWGFSVYVWNRYRINYIFLFDFDPRIVDTPISIFPYLLSCGHSMLFIFVGVFWRMCWACLGGVWGAL